MIARVCVREHYKPSVPPREECSVGGAPVLTLSQIEGAKMWRLSGGKHFIPQWEQTKEDRLNVTQTRTKQPVISLCTHRDVCGLLCGSYHSTKVINI